jgi:hypothetical protein
MTMNIKSVLLLLILFASVNCFSQNKIEIHTANVAKVTFLNPGVSYERSIARLQTLYAQVFMNTAATFSYSGALGNNTKFYFDPALTIQYRYYYNGKRRFERDKRIDMNSMNYVTAVFETVFSQRPFVTGFEENNYRLINSFGLAWGLQRNYKKRFSLDLNLGLGVLFAKSTVKIYPQTVYKRYSQLAPMGQLNIGYWLNKRK